MSCRKFLKRCFTRNYFWQRESSADACRLAEVSRGAFYKYKDSVFLQDFEQQDKPKTIYFKLSDEPGVLSSVLSELYENGANILTVNQNIPVDMVAVVTVSFRLEAFWQNRSKREFEQFLDKLGTLRGVIDVKLI